MDFNYPVICLNHISFAYPGCRPVFNDMDFKIFRGERVGLFGPNGSGKTTLFHIIMGLHRPDSGTVEIFGKKVSGEEDLRWIYKKIGLLFQDSDDQLFCPTVIEDVAFGPINLGKEKDEAVKIAKNTLEQLGLSGFEDRVTHKLSGGEKRLVALATILAMEPEVLLLDEPSTGLDTSTKAKLKEVLSGLDLTLVTISHELDFMTEISDTVYSLENGMLRKCSAVHCHYHVH